METSYTPVPYVYREMIDEEIAKQTCGKIFYFNDDSVVDSLEGTVTHVKDIPKTGSFMVIDPAGEVRIDRIITLFGKPGPAYGEYDAFANACMDCYGDD